MSLYSLSHLIGNPTLEQIEIEQERRDELIPFSGGLPADELDAAFGYDVPPTEEQMDADYAAQQCEAEYDRRATAELVAKYPGLRNLSDQQLIDLIADPPALMGDADEVVTVAAALLAERLGAAA